MDSAASTTSEARRHQSAVQSAPARHLNSAQPRLERLRTFLGAPASATVDEMLTLAERRLGRRAFTIDQALAELAIDHRADVQAEAGGQGLRLSWYMHQHVTIGRLRVGIGVRRGLVTWGVWQGKKQLRNGDSETLETAARVALGETGPLVAWKIQYSAIAHRNGKAAGWVDVEKKGRRWEWSGSVSLTLGLSGPAPRHQRAASLQAAQLAAEQWLLGAVETDEGGRKDAGSGGVKDERSEARP